MSSKKDKPIAASSAEVAPERDEGAEDALETGEDELGVLEEDAFDEFKDYDSLEEEHVGDAQLEALAVDPTVETAEDRDAQVTPKERRLADMRLEARVEAIIFASQKPLKAQEIFDLLQDPGLSVEDVETTLDQIVEFYENRHGGFRLHYLKRLGYQFQTADAAGPIMERMFASRPRPISRAALETLAIIAYRQPVTRAEVEFIRGVDAGSIFKTLLERELIKCTGRKEIVGRPMLFGTTDEFLTVFNLSSVKDLPPLESFQPAREMVQGAMAKIEGGADLVDVEEYIADNTGGEYDEGAEATLDETVAEAAPDGAGEGSVEAQTAVDAPEAPPVRTIQGATAEAPAPAVEEAHGKDQDSEVALATGTGVPTGSGDLDL